MNKTVCGYNLYKTCINSNGGGSIRKNSYKILIAAECGCIYFGGGGVNEL
jgi:hypothetical protein